MRVQPSGAVAWVTWERTNGKTRRVTLGRMEELSLNEARAALRNRRTGKPSRPPIKLTFEELAETFMTAKVGAYRPSTLKILRVYLDSQLLPAFGASRVDRITTPEVAAWFHRYSRYCPGGANQALGHFTTIWNWGRANGHLPHDQPNPASPLRCNRRDAHRRKARFAGFWGNSSGRTCPLMTGCTAHTSGSRTRGP